MTPNRAPFRKYLHSRGDNYHLYNYTTYRKLCNYPIQQPRAGYDIRSNFKVEYNWFGNLSMAVNVWRKSLTAIIQECCKQYWTSPGGCTPQSSSCEATYHSSWKQSKLDEPDMRDTAGEEGTSSSDVLLRTPSHGRAKVGRPARTYTEQLCADTGCSPEDLPEAMDDREGWRERVRDIRADGATWWWWWQLVWIPSSPSPGSVAIIIMEEEYLDS